MNMWRTLSYVSSRERNYDVIITVKINGCEVVGPIAGQDLAIIAKYGAYGPNQDILQSAGYANGERVTVFIEYTER